MRNIITGLILTGCMLPIAAGGMKIASELTKVTAPHQFAALGGEPLWTPDVKRVDVASQSYERVPGTPMPETLVAKARSSAPALSPTLQAAADSSETADNSVAEQQIEAAAQQWCSERYRSYDVSDNSYQPFGGGPRRPCSAPLAVTASIQQAEVASSPAALDEHARWCSSRYSSYRVEDNTYQPFSGGRKQCNSPEIQSASNNMSDDTSDLSASIN